MGGNKRDRLESLPERAADIAAGRPDERELLEKQAKETQNEFEEQEIEWLAKKYTDPETKQVDWDQVKQAMEQFNKDDIRLIEEFLQEVKMTESLTQGQARQVRDWLRAAANVEVDANGVGHPTIADAKEATLAVLIINNTTSRHQVQILEAMLADGKDPEGAVRFAKLLVAERRLPKRLVQQIVADHLQPKQNDEEISRLRRELEQINPKEIDQEQHRRLLKMAEVNGVVQPGVIETTPTLNDGETLLGFAGTYWGMLTALLNLGLYAGSIVKGQEDNRYLGMAMVGAGVGASSFNYASKRGHREDGMLWEWMRKVVSNDDLEANERERLTDMATFTIYESNETKGIYSDPQMIKALKGVMNASHAETLKKHGDMPGVVKDIVVEELEKQAAADPNFGEERLEEIKEFLDHELREDAKGQNARLMELAMIFKDRNVQTATDVAEYFGSSK